MNNMDWWVKPRKVSVLVPEGSWCRPYASELVNAINANGDRGVLCHGYNNLQKDGIAFFFSWLQVASQEVLNQNHRSLVIHASDLPKGRGFSPLPWQIIAGENTIPVCLFEAVDELDAGPVVYRDALEFSGHELINEMRAALGKLHVSLCKRYLEEPAPPAGIAQTGEGTAYSRRRPSNSQLNPRLAISEQFNLLRTVDNHSYPAFFDLHGHRYKITIEKLKNEKPK